MKLRLSKIRFEIGKFELDLTQDKGTLLVVAGLSLIFFDRIVGLIVISLGILYDYLIKK